MKKIIIHVYLIASLLACGKDDGVSTIPNASWLLDKIKFQIDESTELEILSPPAAKIDIQDNSFTYSDTGGVLTGSWALDLTAMELSVTNPDGVELVFPFVSVDNNSWVFVAQTIDLTKTEFTEEEEAALDMVNRKLIEAGKDLDAEIAGHNALKIMFVMKRI